MDTTHACTRMRLCLCGDEPEVSRAERLSHISRSQISQSDGCESICDCNGIRGGNGNWVSYLNLRAVLTTLASTISLTWLWPGMGTMQNLCIHVPCN